jgi:PAS domain S-box-containing protein
MRSPASKNPKLAAPLLVTQVGLGIFAAVSIGLPALALMRSQLERHTRQMLDQSSRTAQALLAEQQVDLENLALLIAQRPNLQQLAMGGDAQALHDYLVPLQTGASLDLIALCSAEGQLIAATGEGIDPAACRPQEEGLDSGIPGSDGLAGVPGNGRVFISTAREAAEGWLLASHPLPEAAGGMRVIAGEKLDDRFVQDLQQGVGLETALYYEGQILAASFSDREVFNLLASAVAPQEIPGPLANPGYQSIAIQGEPFYYLTQPAAGTGLHMVFFFPAGETLQMQKNLTLWAGLGIVLVVLLGSGLGVWRARQVTKPLRQLRRAAEGLRQGDLTTPIVLNTRVKEVSQVAQTLEAARSTLRHSLLQLEQEKAWIEHLLGAVVEGILTIDRRGRITYFSEGAERITGHQATQVLGRSLDEVFTAAEEKVPFSQQLPPPGGRQKVIIQLPDKRQVTLSVTGASLAPPEVGKASAVLVLRDVTDEEALRRLLGEFLANISHEFRTPLSALAASIELLLDQLPDLTPDEVTELISSVHLGVLSLQTLIDNLLEGASIETGRFRVYPRPADLAEILLQAVETMSPLAQKYRQTIRTIYPESLPEVQADPRRTGQVLTNLLSNAIKWNPEGGEITLSAAREGQHIIICVADQGPGIPVDRPSDLFLRFDRTQSREGRAESGAGLGLSVVKAIVEAQGGQVGVRNQTRHGAEFWFTLPVLESEAAREEAEP